MKKQCERCGISFFTNRKLKRFCNRQCKHKSKEKRRFKILREKVIISLGGKCQKCGISDLEVLQIDHIESLKKTKNKRMFYSKFFNKIIKKEINDIQLLCANCHIKKTNKEK